MISVHINIILESDIMQAFLYKLTLFNQTIKEQHSFNIIKIDLARLLDHCNIGEK